MGLTMHDTDLWLIAADVLTPKELHAYELRHRHNLSLRQIALALDISVSTVRQRLFNADRKIAGATTRGDAAA